MLGEHRVAALVPARGGSKGLPGKNLRLLGGRPLLRWTLDVAAQVPAIDAVYVSTDDEQIAREVRAAGAVVSPRPAELADDQALVIDAIRYHLRQWRGTPEAPGIVVLLQPTSPLRSAADVEASLRPLLEGSHDSAATFCRCGTHLQRLWRPVDGTVEPLLAGADPWQPRQQLPDLYEINGAVYTFFADRLPDAAQGPLFGRIAPVLMPAERSIDIDSAFDLAIAEALLAGRRGDGPPAAEPP
jgi:CMP-N,N'-diacetyllegionaminic acid synthase